MTTVTALVERNVHLYDLHNAHVDALATNDSSAHAAPEALEKSESVTERKQQ
jgi:hypothetical protein